MKIRYLIANAYPAGGTIRTSLNMANMLSERGHDVEVVSIIRRRVPTSFPVDPEVRMRPLVDTSTPGVRRSTWLRPFDGQLELLERWAGSQPSKLFHPGDVRYQSFNLHTDYELLKFLRSTKDGIIIGTRPGVNLALARFGQPSAIRIGQEHLHLAKHKADLRAAYLKYYPRLDAFATLTPTDASDYRTMLGNNGRIIDMPNAAPDMGGARADLDAKVVVAAGRLTSQKGFDMLIPAFAQVAAKHPDWQLRIFGGGDKEAELAQLIEEHGIGENVTLMGYTSELPQEMAKGSIYALSSRFEGFPMVLLEAISVGLAPVSFDCPTGPRDIIEHGQDGLLVEYKDVDALAASIIELIEEDARRKAMGEAAYEKSKRYQTEAIAERWETVFEDIARRRNIKL